MINIFDKTKCCGCEACLNICSHKCIEMKSDDEGFLYPFVNATECINCGLCEKVCPINNKPSQNQSIKKKAAIVQHKDKEILRQSTAGGAFTAIAQYVLEKGGIVFGARLTDEFYVEHDSVDSTNDLYLFRNSKYVQSDINNSYRRAKEQLDSGRLVCFSGTPCQIAGFSNFLSKPYENLVLVDVVCRAVPSPGVWNKYIQMVQSKNGKINSVRFRDKKLGYQYSTMVIKFENQMEKRGGIESDPWLRMFFSGMIIRPSCTDCQFRDYHRIADFTIWDCYNSYRIDKSIDESVGSTRVLIHTKKGRDIFDSIKDKISYKEISVDTAINGVKEMCVSPMIHIQRKSFFTDYDVMTMEELLQKYFPVTSTIKAKKWIRVSLNKIGLDRTIKHIMKKG